MRGFIGRRCACLDLRSWLCVDGNPKRAACGSMVGGVIFYRDDIFAKASMPANKCSVDPIILRIVLAIKSDFG